MSGCHKVNIFFVALIHNRYAKMKLFISVTYLRNVKTLLFVQLPYGITRYELYLITESHSLTKYEIDAKRLEYFLARVTSRTNQTRIYKYWLHSSLLLPPPKAVLVTVLEFTIVSVRLLKPRVHTCRKKRGLFPSGVCERTTHDKCKPGLLVVAMDVLLNYCINSLLSWSIYLIEYWSTSFKIGQLSYCLFVIGRYVLWREIYCHFSETTL